LLQMIRGPLLAYLEPCPEDEDLQGAFEPEVFIGMLEVSLRS
jgi:hypothetical protein